MDQQKQHLMEQGDDMFPDAVSSPPALQAATSLHLSTSSSGEQSLCAVFPPRKMKMMLGGIGAFTVVLAVFVSILVVASAIAIKIPWFASIPVSLIAIAIMVAMCVCFLLLAGHVVRFEDRAVEVKVFNLWLGERWVYKTHRYPYDEISYLQVRFRQGDSDTMGTTLNMVMRGTGQLIQFSFDQASIRERDTALNYLDIHTDDGYGTQFSRSDPRELIMEMPPNGAMRFSNNLHHLAVAPLNAPQEFIHTYSHLVAEINPIITSRWMPVRIVNTILTVSVFLTWLAVPVVAIILLIALEMILTNRYYSTIEGALAGIVQRYNVNSLHGMGLEAEFKIQNVKSYGVLGLWGGKYHTLIFRSIVEQSSTHNRDFDAV